MVHAHGDIGMAVQHGRANRANGDGPIQLHQFLRFIAGRAGVARDRPHASNDDLINNLRRMGVLTSCAPPPPAILKSPFKTSQNLLSKIFCIHGGCTVLTP